MGGAGVKRKKSVTEKKGDNRQSLEGKDLRRTGAEKVLSRR